MAGFPLSRYLVISALALGGVAHAQANPDPDPDHSTDTGSQLESMEARGTVGPYPVGLNYTVKHHTELVTAHYFYTSQLKNIPLTGAVHGEAVTWHGADGSNFDLHFVGNGSNGKAPLTFYNSVGLRGTWTLGTRILPVSLQFAYSTANPGQRLYKQVTDQPDAAYEAMVATIRQAILDGNKAETARFVQFPLRLYTTPPLVIRNAAELTAHWAHIFTPAFLAKLRTDVPHEMFVHEGEAMLGDGELWFDDKGLVSMNPLPPPEGTASRK